MNDHLRNAVHIRLARRNSRFRVAMLASGIPLGHTATHSPLLVQPPKSSASMVWTRSRTRCSRSGPPWGRVFRCVIFAEVNSVAEPFGHAATHAPHPMHAAL